MAAYFAPEVRLDHRLLDKELEALYRHEERLGQFFGAFSVVAILIACMGLCGLAAFAAQARTKEIDIRKALGAQLGSVLKLLSAEFSLVIVVALILGFSAGYYAMDRWLGDFAYRITIGAGLVATSAVIAIATTAVAVAIPALRAARVDPVEAMRTK